ncbi:MAG: YceI family protein [Blastocatellia bacterium]
MRPRGRIDRGSLGCAMAMALLLSAPAPAPAQRGRPKAPPRIYGFDAAESRIDVTLTQEGLLSKRYPTHRVVAKTFAGRIELPRDETRLAVTLEADAKSMTNADEAMGDFERRGFHDVLRNAVLEVEKHPTIRFVSASVNDVRRSGNTRNFSLTGDLLLHGVTKRVSFPVHVTLGNEELRATGEAKLKQSDFGMQPFEKGLGLIKIGDEVKVSFSIVARETVRSSEEKRAK